MTTKAPVRLMEPMLPEEGDRVLDDMALDLVDKAKTLAGQLNPIVRESVGNLVRSMNCYYSNLIEGHNTHPRDIERALSGDYSNVPEQRQLQLEAKAHIEVQRMIDVGEVPAHFLSSEYICWLHKEFCTRLPEEMLIVSNPDTGKKIKVRPGELRTGGVQVGLHVGQNANSLPDFLHRFESVYSPQHLSRLRKIIAIPASHHRLLWIHPFYDGNGRVTRLLSHAYLKKTGVGNLWSVSRGLARNSTEYKSLLMAADNPRYNDLDGRGSRTAQGLKAFCEFFLKVCADQVSFMASILEPSSLLSRMERYTQAEIHAKKLPKGSFLLLREALYTGEFHRGRTEEILNYKERQSRTFTLRAGISLVAM